MLILKTLSLDKSQNIRYLKLLFILPEYYPHSGGGISTYYQELIPALLPYCSKIKVLVGSGYSHGGRDFNHNGIEVSYLETGLFKSYLSKFTKFQIFPELMRNLAAAWAMWEQVKEEEFDAVECTDFGLGFVPWLTHHNRPVKIQMHGSSGQIGFFDPKNDDALECDVLKQIELTFFKLADLLQTHSTANKIFWEKQLSPTKILSILPIYQNLSPITNFSDRQESGLVTGRIQYWKGPSILCKAHQLLRNQKYEINWLGRDMPYGNNQKSMNQWLATNFPTVWGFSVKPIGVIKNDEIRKAQSQAKFGLVPSIWDMFNFSCLEFMAAGTLTICADGAGASEVIDNGKNGFTYSAEDPQALANVLLTVSKLTAAAYNSIAQEGQKTIKNELSADNLGPVYINAFKKIIEDFKVTDDNEYLNAIYSPSNDPHELGELLNKQPLKLIVKHIASRLRNKITKKNQ